MGFSTAPTFPSMPGLGIPVIRRPMWNTLIQTSVGGVDTPINPWTYPRYEYELGYAFLRQAAAWGELQSLMGFFNSCGGRATTFQYKDPQDGASTANQTLGIAASTTAVSTSSFQTIRTRGSFVEPVFAVDTVTKMLVANSSVSSTTFTVSNTGVVSFSTGIPVGSTVAWQGTFNWLCRFTKDTFDFEQFTASTDSQGPLWSLKVLTFQTVKFGA